MSAYVGKPVKRVEDPRLVRGAATYVDDLRLPGTLHAVFVRSPHAHAKVLSIKGPDGVRFFTGRDINDQVGTIPCSTPMPDQKSPKHTVLAGDRAYFVGHPVALVVAPTREAAADAAALVEVDYDPLPAVVDPVKALEKGSPLTHPELGTNRAFTWSVSGGDFEAALKKADRVLKISMVHPRLTPMPIEPRGCVAQWDAGAGSLTLWTSTQIPHLIRGLLPELIGVPENRIRVVAPEVGGGFGAKLNLYPEEVVVCHLARRLGAPLKWIETRRENAAATIHGRDQVAAYEIGVRKDGTVLGIRSKTIADVGAYNQLATPAIPTLTGLMLPGCYAIRAVRMDVTGVHTHKMATDAYRGAGRPEATYVIERVMDLVADELGMDPVDVRLKNMIRPDQFPYDTASGLTYDSGNYQGALRKAQELSDYKGLLKKREAARKAGKLFGVGLSTYVEICALGPSKMMSSGGWEWGSVRIDMTGAVTVVTGATPHGQGQETSFAQIAAERLGVKMEDVVVLRGDTATAPYGRDTYGSRATALGGTAIVLSIDKILAKAKVLAKHLLKAKDVVFENGRFRSGKKSIGIKELAAEAYVAQNLPKNFEPGLEASSFFEPSNCTYPFGTHIVAVEIDAETGAVKIVSYTAVDDCGNQINPLLVEGQVQGGIAQALGAALMERTVYDENGQLLTGEFMDYAIPRAADIPDAVIGSTRTPSPSNPLGVKGVGEAGTIGAAPAIANAVIDALSPLGIRHLDLPFLPEKVWTAIREAKR